MSFIVERPISIKSKDLTSSTDNESKLVYNFKSVDAFDIKKFTSSSLNINGIELSRHLTNDPVVKYKNMYYILNKIILSNNCDNLDSETNNNYCLILDLITSNMTDNLYIVIPINTTKQSSISIPDANEFVSSLISFSLSNVDDINSSNNVVFDTYDDASNKLLSQFDLNSLIPKYTRVYGNYYYKDGSMGLYSSDVSQFIVFSSLETTLYIDSSDLSQIKNLFSKLGYTNSETNVPSDKSSIKLCTISPIKKRSNITVSSSASSKKDDIYIDCSPISDSKSGTEVINPNNNVFVMKSIFGDKAKNSSLFAIKVLTTIICVVLVVFGFNIGFGFIHSYRSHRNNTSTNYVLNDPITSNKMGFLPGISKESTLNGILMILGILSSINGVINFLIGPGSNNKKYKTKSSPVYKSLNSIGFKLYEGSVFVLFLLALVLKIGFNKNLSQRTTGILISIFTLIIAISFILFQLLNVVLSFGNTNINILVTSILVSAISPVMASDRITEFINNN